MQRKLLEIISVDFDTTGQLLIIHSPFVRYLRKYGNAMKQCISYFQTKQAYDSVRREVLCNIFAEFGNP